MPIDIVVSDYDGTLTSDPDLGRLWSAIGKGLALRALKTLHFGRFSSLLRTKRELEELKARRTELGEPAYESASYDIFNEQVLRGSKAATIERLLDKYCAAAAERLDPLLLKPLDDALAHSELRKLAIVSTGSAAAIERTLKHGPYHSVHSNASHHIFANHFRYTDGAIAGFGPEDGDLEREKKTGFLQLFCNQRAKPERMAYIGNDERDRDYLQDAVRLGGRAIVAPNATDDFKQACASLYKAFVPESERDFRAFLQKA